MESDSDRNFEEYIVSKNGSIDGFLSPWGRFIKDLVEPAIIDLFKARGREYNQLSSGVRSYRENPPMEISLMVSDDEEMIVVECKPRLSCDHVDNFIDKLKRFKRAFNSYENFRVYGAVAGIEINQGVDQYACQKGLFVVKPSGDTVEIINEANFKPIAW